MFQSSPSPKAGSYAVDDTYVYVGGGFNPLPARRPGATSNRVETWRHPNVSILSQPEGRELLAKWRLSEQIKQFQSSPSPKAGSYLISDKFFIYIILFQSSPSPKAGSYCFHLGCYCNGSCFNPLPARRPGATDRDGIVRIESMFQSSPSPKAGSYVLTEPFPECF